MTLGDLLPLIADNPKLDLKIIDSDNTSIITFNASGYSAISDELNSRELDKVVIAEIVHDDVMFKLYLKPIPDNTIPLDPDQLIGSQIGP